MKKRIAVYCWAGLGNIGDDWLLEIACKTFNAFEVVLVTEPRARLKLTQDLEILTWPRLRCSPTELRAFRQQLNSCSALVLAGGGWFAGDRGPREPLLWLRRLRMVNIPVAAVGLGAGPFNGVISASAAKHSLRHLKPLGPWFVRSGIDAQNLKKVGFADVAVSTDPVLGTNFESGTSRSGVIVSLATPSDHWFQGDVEQWAERIARQVFDAAGGEHVRFASFQTQEHDDKNFWLRYFPLELDASTPQAMLDAMGHARAVVAGRLHAALAAAVTNVPDVATLAYHHKFDVVRRTGLPVTDARSGQITFGSVDPKLLAEQRDLASSALSQTTRNLAK